MEKIEGQWILDIHIPLPEGENGRSERKREIGPDMQDIREYLWYKSSRLFSNNHNTEQGDRIATSPLRGSSQ